MIAIAPLAVAAIAACGGSSKSGPCVTNVQHQQVCGAAAVTMCQEFAHSLPSLFAQKVPVAELNRVGHECVKAGVHVLRGGS